MPARKSPACLCGSGGLETVLVYDAPPAGENLFSFSRGGNYYREVRRCPVCGHFLSVHDLDLRELYSEDYVRSLYTGPEGMRQTFERINALPPQRSDNVGRVARILAFVEAHFSPDAFAGRRPTLLDVGAGLCVFPYRMRLAGFACTALDPDQRAARHAVECAGVEGLCADFMAAEPQGRYDLLTFNKVLEHVLDPVAMLARSAHWLRPGGLVYLEVPDGEAAIVEGGGREEFFVEHHHAFSPASLAILVARAGFSLLTLERLREPSSKFTLRAFLETREASGCAKARPCSEHERRER